MLLLDFMDRADEAFIIYINNIITAGRLDELGAENMRNTVLHNAAGHVLVACEECPYTRVLPQQVQDILPVVQLLQPVVFRSLDAGMEDE